MYHIPHNIYRVALGCLTKLAAAIAPQLVGVQAELRQRGAVRRLL